MLPYAPHLQLHFLLEVIAEKMLWAVPVSLAATQGMKEDQIDGIDKSLRLMKLQNNFTKAEGRFIKSR